MTVIAPDQPRLATEIAQLWPPQGQWTESDYFNLPDTNRLVELSEGEILLMAPPSFTHQIVLDNLHSALKSYVRKHGLGRTAFAPVAVRLWPGKIREPDILFYANAHLDRIGEMVSGPPDLVMEILSPGTRQTDRREKYAEYAQAGIAEYWMVDPEEETIEVFVLAEGAYRLLVKAGAGEKARSALLAGFEVLAEEAFA
ncbi:MAG: Uma2 family endonuclease [Chloroflexi bacterium]|nr:Uma2 family endonuclease [Ardenticatenaceae bacterium]MBL1131197.1 Uma2 family endonuclease [Chloroflexota bacterium]NOG37298.1 Uma2 family endonuclease [Chloroflexota bacterium]GIK57019.1 MAG: restriction endonuclease [Chloroflexota bacterium]